MGSAIPISQDTSKLETVIQRKDAALDKASAQLRRLWALAWLAHHASDSGLSGFTSEDLADANAVVMKEIVALSAHVQAAFTEHDAVRGAVMRGDIS